MDTTGFFKVSEFLKLYALSRTEFYRQAQQGAIRLTKLGRATRVAKADAKAWADALPTFGREA